VINAYLKQIGVNVTVSTKLDPAKWARAKAKAKAKMGGHSARAMQLATKYYKDAGGRYKGPKKKSNKLSKWTKQKWKTKSGKPSSQTGERYLPEKAIKALSPKEYAATTKAKRAGTTQFVKQPKKIARKTRKYRTA
jgi:hypothetical protein